MIKYYANPVLFDLVIDPCDGERTIRSNLHGIYLIEQRDDGDIYAYLLNNEIELSGTRPLHFYYHKYATNSWMMYYDNSNLDALDYREGTVRVIIHPLSANSKTAHDIRVEYNNFPTKIEESLHENNNF